MNVPMVVLAKQEMKMSRPHEMCEMTSAAGEHSYHNLSRFTFYLL
jgi:hypothetical protein